MESLNPRLQRKHSARPDLRLLVDGILSGDRRMLSKAITLLESARESHQELAAEVLEACLPYTGKSVRIGITGAPGVGKSTFIDEWGLCWIQNGKKVAVLAIDPSSRISQGSILGDKTRMEKLGSREDVFIRPSAAGNLLGGVARATRESMLLCEAAGFDLILVETVGVGQSETTVATMVDCLLLLLSPGGGDELQGIKRGIVEMADILVVNKAEDEQVTPARNTRQAYAAALHLFPPKTNGWTPEVLTCSALKAMGLQKVLETAGRFTETLRQNGAFELQRNNQTGEWWQTAIGQHLRNQFFNHPGVQALLPKLEAEVLSGKRAPYQAARQLIAAFNHKV